MSAPANVTEHNIIIWLSQKEPVLAWMENDLNVRHFSRCCCITEQSKWQTTGSKPWTSSVAQAIPNKPQSFELGCAFLLYQISKYCLMVSEMNL